MKWVASCCRRYHSAMGGLLLHGYHLTHASRDGAFTGSNSPTRHVTCIHGHHVTHVSLEADVFTGTTSPMRHVTVLSPALFRPSVTWRHVSAFTGITSPMRHVTLVHQGRQGEDGLRREGSVPHRLDLWGAARGSFVKKDNKTVSADRSSSK